MRGYALLAMASTALLVVSPACAQQSPDASNAGNRAGASERLPHQQLLSLDEAKRQPHGHLGKIVLDFLTVMDRVVNKDKQPAITAMDWQPLGELIDRPNFRRVGNFGVRNDWVSYTGLLTQWSNHNWWKGYIWRMREVPSADGKSGLVYLETEERSNPRHPVMDDGDYNTLASISVYEINREGKISALWVYDQRPR